MSSKRPVSRYREVVHVPKKTGLDPRFERISGKFNEDLFMKTYAFVSEKRKEEIRYGLPHCDSISGIIGEGLLERSYASMSIIKRKEKTSACPQPAPS